MRHRHDNGDSPNQKTTNSNRAKQLIERTKECAAANNDRHESGKKMKNMRE